MSSSYTARPYQSAIAAYSSRPGPCVVGSGTTPLVNGVEVWLGVEVRRRCDPTGLSSASDSRLTVKGGRLVRAPPVFPFFCVSGSEEQHSWRRSGKRKTHSSKKPCRNTAWQSPTIHPQRDSSQEGLGTPGQEARTSVQYWICPVCGSLTECVRVT